MSTGEILTGLDYYAEITMPEISWSGCNYHVDMKPGTSIPSGTATSMYICGSCSALSYCEVRKDDEVWEWSPEIAEEMKAAWLRTLKIKYGDEKGV